MKIRILVLSLLALCFTNSFCAASNVVLSTMAIFANAGDTITCTASNLNGSPLDATVSILDFNGAVLGSETITLQSQSSTAMGGSSVGQYYRCVFTFKGKKSLKGGMSLNVASNRPYAVVPAN